MNRRQWFSRFASAGCPLGLCWLAACGADQKKNQKPVGLATAVANPMESPAGENLPGKSGAIEVLLFDIFGTVVEWRASLISQFQA